MKAAPPLAAILLLAAGACDRPKPRPAAAAAAAAAAAGIPTLAPPASAGLARRAEAPTFYLDLINEAGDPLGQPAKIKAGQPTTFAGFGFDPLGKTPGKAVDIVIDGVAYGATYGGERPDVAAYFKIDAVTPCGFRVTLPAGTVRRGAHTVAIRVVAADGMSFFESAPIGFQAR